MNQTVPIIDDSTRGLYPIRTVSELTGVNSITLRAWEKRHDLIEPIRKESGHRLYTQQHIDLINQVVGLLDRGMRIGQVKAYLDAQADTRKAPGEADEVVDTWSQYLDGMVAAVIRFDEEALERVYDEALASYPVRMVTRKLLTPLLTELGERWSLGKGTIAEEHFFGFYLRNKLGARFHHRTRGSRGPKLLMACLPGDRHEIGLLLFALAASEEGYRTVVLGADMPIEEMAAAAVRIEADAIVLSGFLQPARAVFKRLLPDLATEVNIPVLIGGRVSVESLDELRRMDIESLGVDVDTGLKRLQSAVPLD